MTPLYALHKDADGNILDATATSYNFELRKWLESLDPRPGDVVEFGAKHDRTDAEVKPNVTQITKAKAS